MLGLTESEMHFAGNIAGELRAQNSVLILKWTAPTRIPTRRASEASRFASL